MIYFKFFYICFLEEVLTIDWQIEAINDLRKYNGYKQSLDIIPRQMRGLDEATTSIKCTLSDREPVKGGTSKAEDRLINNIAKKERLKHNYLAVAYLVKLIDEALDTLTARQRLILDEFYIKNNKAAVRDLCVKLNYEKSHIYRLRDEALRDFVLHMYGIRDL